MKRQALVLAFLIGFVLAWIAPARATDCSGTITTGGTAQVVYSTGNARIAMVMNNSANLMCMSITGTLPTIAGTNCGAGSYSLQPGSATAAGGSYVTPDGIKATYLGIISSTTGDRFSCERQ